MGLFFPQPSAKVRERGEELNLKKREEQKSNFVLIPLLYFSLLSFLIPPSLPSSSPLSSSSSLLLPPPPPSSPLLPSPPPPPSFPIQPLIIVPCLLPVHQWWRVKGWRGTVCPRWSPFYRTSHLRRTASSFLLNTQALGGKLIHLSICNSELQIFAM